MSAVLSPAAPASVRAAEGTDRQRRVLDTLETVELPDGTRVGVRPAGPGPRAVAWFIDILIYVAAVAAMMVIMMFIDRAAAGVGQGIGAILGFLLYWGYHVYFEAGPKGATPGKRAMNLRVVRTDGSPAGLNPVILRNIARVVDVMPLPTYLTGLISCLCTRRFQRLGDLLADTVVVHVEPAQRREAPQPLPPEAGPVIPEPPPAALLRDERAAIVQFMERAVRWSPSRQEEMAAHAEPLLNCTGLAAVRRLLGMGIWLRDAAPGQPKPGPPPVPGAPGLPRPILPPQKVFLPNQKR